MKYLRLKDNVDYKKLEKFGFKFGVRDKFLYKTKNNGCEAKIYIDLLPCNNKHNKLYIESDSHTLPEKIIIVLFDIVKADLVELVEDE